MKHIKIKGDKVLFYSKKGVFVLPDEWKELLGEDVINYKKPLTLHLVELGAATTRNNATRFRRLYLSRSKEFLAWYDPIKQHSLSISTTEFNEKQKELYSSVKYLQSRKEGLNQASSKHKEKVSSILNSKEWLSKQIFRRFKGQQNAEKLIEDELKGIDTLSEYAKKRILDANLIPLESVAHISNAKFKACCKLCGHVSIFHFRTGGIVSSCPFCGHNHSVLERTILAEVEKAGFIAESGNRTILDGKEIDVYIPQLRIGIEANGIYSHNSTKNFSDITFNSRNRPKSIHYHFDKTENALKKGVRLFHLWDHRHQDLVYLQSILEGSYLDVFKNKSLPDLFKLRRDWFPEKPVIEGYEVKWYPEVWITDRNGKDVLLDSKDAVITYTSGLWICKKFK